MREFTAHDGASAEFRSFVARAGPPPSNTPRAPPSSLLSGDRQRAGREPKQCKPHIVSRAKMATPSAESRAFWGRFATLRDASLRFAIVSIWSTEGAQFRAKFRAQHTPLSVRVPEIYPSLGAF